MIPSFLHFIEKNALINEGETVLLAVSGGMDSMVMVHLFKEAGLDFGIAHCNFQLRGEASVGDELLVKQTAQQLDIPFFTIRFDTAAAASHYKTSIQVVARELRYEWLEEIRTNNGYQSIATAHHLNDSLETILYNLSKGCGIRGLHGIPMRQGSIIRPLLFTNRADISRYCKQEGIEYREDASNATTKYARNLIRHKVIPELALINPSLLKTFSGTLSQIQDTELLFQESIARYKDQLVEQKGELFHIQLPPIHDHPAKATILYELISAYGFNATQIEQLLSDKTQVGAICVSETHELLKDRKKWICRLKKSNKENFKLVNINTELVIIGPRHLSFQMQDKKDTTIIATPSYAYLDYHKLAFPLTLRQWQAGDMFQPFGMNGNSKKIQDYLSDQKLSRFEKEEVLILESGGKIAWVVGYRIDERFKVQATTKTVLLISLKEKAL